MNCCGHTFIFYIVLHYSNVHVWTHRTMVTHWTNFCVCCTNNCKMTSKTCAKMNFKHLSYSGDGYVGKLILFSVAEFSSFVVTNGCMHSIHFHRLYKVLILLRSIVYMPQCTCWISSEVKTCSLPLWRELWISRNCSDCLPLVGYKLFFILYTSIFFFFFPSVLNWRDSDFASLQYFALNMEYLLYGVR